MAAGGRTVQINVICKTFVVKEISDRAWDALQNLLYGIFVRVAFLHAEQPALLPLLYFSRHDCCQNTFIVARTPNCLRVFHFYEAICKRRLNAYPEEYCGQERM